MEYEPGFALEERKCFECGTDLLAPICPACNPHIGKQVLHYTTAPAGEIPVPHVFKEALAEAWKNWACPENEGTLRFWEAAMAAYRVTYSSSRVSGGSPDTFEGGPK